MSKKIHHQQTLQTCEGKIWKLYDLWLCVIHLADVLTRGGKEFSNQGQKSPKK